MAGPFAENWAGADGPNLMLRVIDESQEKGLRHFFFGGGEGVAELLREKIQSRFPRAQIVGSHTPPFVH
ncbi:MAG TPA: hypothetical protein DHW22_01475 [Planctomycetaceae bacterium]|nr:hypothetical protein [Planctomycetaceae bacterium]